MKKRIMQGDKIVGYYNLNPKRFSKSQKFAMKVKSTMTTIALYTLGTALVLGGMAIGRNQFPVIIEKVLAQEIFVDNLTPKINQLKDDVVTEIQNCERAGFTEDDGLITFDPHKSNKRVQPASLGELQFKVKTVQHYYKTLYAKDITAKEAIIIALDTDKARELTRDIIFTTNNGLSNWYTCGNKQVVQQKLSAIKELQR